jgi:galactokinase
VKTDGGTITVKSAGYAPFSVSVDDLAVDGAKFGTSEALLRGVVKGFLDKGYKVGGFTAHADSDIFKGAGVSSSAAFELLLCEILNVMYNGGKVGFVEKAIISRFAENVYFGKPSGLMDQLTISRGGVSFMNFRDDIPFSESAPWNFDDLSLIIVNCGGDHCNLTGEYSAIRYEMNSVAAYFGKTVLAEVSEKDFENALPDLKTKFAGRAILRAIHFFEENKRVEKSVAALENNDRKSFLGLITESGLSSYTLLQNCYPSGDTQQPVPLALAIARRNRDTLACRVHGGGFAGTVLAFTETRNKDSYVEYMSRFFGRENVFGVKIRKFGAIKIAR